MPATPATPPERNILLVEEYDALAVAIESALKKFAPNHCVHIVGSLNQARTTSLEHRPELIIVDFDPPHPGAIMFFQELQSALPESRVLVIASGTSREVVAERGANGALQLLEKPFELVEFGASVQALLGPWSETGTSRGTLRDLGLVDAVTLGCLAGNNSVIHVKAGTKRTGQLELQNGHIVHATSSNLEGKQALVEMIAWKKAFFSESVKGLDARRTIQGPWASVLVEAIREARRQSYPEEPLAAKPQTPGIPESATGPKLLIIDDTEMLLIFAEDSLMLANPNLQIATSLTGLHGVKEAARIVPDLVLVDYSLPDIKGDEVCRRIGANQVTARVPIIMMSGHVHEMAAAAVKLPNVVATIAKPFLSEALVVLVQKTLTAGPLPETEMTEEKGSGPAVVLPGLISPPASAPLPSSKKIALKRAAASNIARRQTNAGTEAAAPVTPPRLTPNEVMLDLPLDVIAMQVNSYFQIGSIRARPASPTVAIEIPALAARTALPLETAFQLGTVELDRAGRICTVRLIPTPHRFCAVETRNAFAIGGVTVVPANERERLQLMSAANSSMTMQLFAPLELVSVELSPNLEVEQLVLRCRSGAVRVTLNSENSKTHSGASFETTAVQLDNERRISELTLAPVS